MCLALGLMGGGVGEALSWAQEAAPSISVQFLPWLLLTSSPLCLPALGTRPTPEQCRGDSGHIPCMARGSSKEACQQAGCCYDNTRDVPCYYGNTGTPFHAQQGPIL